MASLPSLPVSFPSIGNTLLPRLGSFALLKGPKARSFSIRFCFADLSDVGVVGFVKVNLQVSGMLADSSIYASR